MRVPHVRNVSVNTTNQTSNWYIDKQETNAHQFFFYIECVCNAWFTIEILVSKPVYELNVYVYDRRQKVQIVNWIYAHKSELVIWQR